MIRVVHLFDLKKGVNERAFIEWLDAKLDEASKRFGCVDRKSWILLEGFVGDYRHPTQVKDRPKYVNEAYWHDLDGPRQLRDWLLKTPEGQDVHHQWFSSIQNHTVLRYVEGWNHHPTDE